VTPYLTSALLGILIAGGILVLVRRDQLHGSFAVWWLSVALVALLVGFLPRSVDWLGGLFGVNYPPMLVALVGIGALLLKLLVVDLDMTRSERRVRRLLQKVAILEAEMRDLRTELDLLRSELSARAAATAQPTDATPAPVAASEARRTAAG
jgi:hypothetical protein